MQSELNQIIEAFETEKNNLDYFIKEYLEEEDYLYAHKLTPGLYEVKNMLRSLHKLGDPYYHTKAYLERTKTFFQVDLSIEVDENLKNYFKEKIAKIDKQLKILSTKESNPTVEKQDLDDAIYDLIEKKIHAFRFNLIKEQNFYLEFSYPETNILSISFPPNRVEEDYGSGTYLSELKKLGFSLNEGKNRLEYFYDLKTFRNTTYIKTIIARIIFDIYSYSEFDHPTFIEIITNNK